MKSFYGPIVAALWIVTSAATPAAPAPVVIQEIAWMGTTYNYRDEWIELYNPTADAVYLGGWTLVADDGTPEIELAGVLPPAGYFLLECVDDDSVPGVGADLVYGGALENTGDALTLRDADGTVIDRVDAWYAGDNSTKATMSRVSSSAPGVDPGNWITSTTAYDGGFGTPTRLSEQLNSVETGAGAINVYFNRGALPQYGRGTAANYYVNLEDRLIARLAAATATIDMATYELNLPGVLAVLLERADAGVRVRVIADSKDYEVDTDERFDTFGVYLELLRRGLDGDLATPADNAAVFCDAPIFAVTDGALRLAHGLSAAPDDLPIETLTVGDQPMSGHVLCHGELEEAPANYYSRGPQMHNKFVVVDGTWVWTGSWNFTVTGLYGTYDNLLNGTLDGNTNHAIELHSVDLAAIYTTEFEEMWGSHTVTPNPVLADFHGRKVDNTSHVVSVGGRTVEVYFSPGDNAIGHVVQRVTENADVSAHFAVFAWSDQNLVDALKLKWEGDVDDLEGEPTGFVVQGVFDSLFWNQYWSASIDLTGRLPSEPTEPPARWATPAPVFPDGETRKLHHKYLILDAQTQSEPMVVTGSTNWSVNGEEENDENLLILHDAGLADQFLQEFYVRYARAGGELPCGRACVFDDGFESGDVSAWSTSRG